MRTTLNIAQLCPETRALGPGKRFVIWVQGCPFACRGCIAPDWIPIKRATTVTVNCLAERILSVADLEGITLSGGEPMLQAEALDRLIKLVRKSRPSLSVIAFSGFTLDRLRDRSGNDKALARLLSSLDVLIDGLYVEDLNNAKGLRGSSNQRVHFLTSRYSQLKDELENGLRKIELHLLNDGLLLTGVPTMATLTAVRRTAEVIRDAG